MGSETRNDLTYFILSFIFLILPALVLDVVAYSRIRDRKPSKVTFVIVSSFSICSLLVNFSYFIALDGYFEGGSFIFLITLYIIIATFSFLYIKRFLKT